MPIQNSPYADTGSNIRRGLENIAGLFAPPSASDLAGYADAGLKNQRREIISKLQTDPRYAGFDHQAILADLFDPTQSFYKVNLDDSTTRRGQDITAATSRANNASDNQRQFVTEMFTPLNQGQVRPAVPTDIGSLFGVSTPLPQVAGAPKPLSESEVQGGLLERAIRDGLITPEDAALKEKSMTNVENIVGPGGAPKTVARADAIGQQPYFNQGAEAKPENAVAKLRDGTTVPALQRQDGKWVHAQTGAELPSDIQIFKVPQAQGTADQVGLTTSTESGIQQQLIDITVAKDTATKLRDMIASSPASQGIVGWLRGTAQNVIQTGGELGTFFGGGVAEAMKDIENGLADASLAGSFDANIPAIEMLANLLAFQYAKTTTGERLSNEMLRASKEALGLNGLDANQANSLARLNQAIAQIEAQQKILQDFTNKGLHAVSPSTSPPPGAAPMLPAGVTEEDIQFTMQKHGLSREEVLQRLGGQ